jgi:protein-S-isoprenylcysteine O-methyltransferase Ste14
LKLRLDTDYIVLAVLLGVFGVVGITATASIHPNVLNLDSCSCIPSPAARLQELSVVFIAFALVLAPVGWLKSGTPQTSSMRQQGHVVATGGLAEAGPMMSNSHFFFLGVALVILGITLVAVPSFLVLKNTLMLAEGVGVIVLGALFAYTGGRSN